MRAEPVFELFCTVSLPAPVTITAEEALFITRLSPSPALILTSFVE